MTSSNQNEFAKKKVQFATFFQILSDGRPLVEYESCHELYDFLNVPNNPQKHGANCTGWGLVECMFDEV